MIEADDRGLLLGDGLFETVLWENGALAAFEAHTQRLIAGCATLGLPSPDGEALKSAAMAAIADAGLENTRAAVRLTWTAGSGGRGLDRPAPVRPRLIATAAAAPKPTTPARLIVSTIRRNEGSPAARLKTLAYLDNILARREARAAGADEALMLNNRSEIAGAAAANVFWFEGDSLVTPALKCGVLAGIMRAAVIERARGLGWTVREDRAPVPVLTGARGMFLTNSLIELRAVATLGGRTVQPHPHFQALRQKALAFPRVTVGAGPALG